MSAGYRILPDIENFSPNVFGPIIVPDVWYAKPSFHHWFTHSLSHGGSWMAATRRENEWAWEEEQETAALKAAMSGRRTSAGFCSARESCIPNDRPNDRPTEQARKEKKREEWREIVY